MRGLTIPVYPKDSRPSNALTGTKISCSNENIGNFTQSEE